MTECIGVNPNANGIVTFMSIFTTCIYFTTFVSCSRTFACSYPILTSVSIFSHVHVHIHSHMRLHSHFVSTEQSWVPNVEPPKHAHLQMNGQQQNVRNQTECAWRDGKEIVATCSRLWLGLGPTKVGIQTHYACVGGMGKRNR